MLHAQNRKGFHAQDRKGKLIVNIGFHETDLYKKPFYFFTYPNGGGALSQGSATFLDLNVLYELPIKDGGFSAVFGAGANQKGFAETGENANAIGFPYTSKLKKTYISIYFGMSYDLFTWRNSKLTIGQLINPDIEADKKNGVFKKFPIGARTFLTLERNLNRKTSLRISPYFQTGITRYNKTKLSAGSSNFTPYGFGFSLGLGFGG